MVKIKCSLCPRQVENPKFLHGRLLQRQDDIIHKCLKCGKEVCYTCFVMIINTDKGFCKPCFKGLDMINPIDLSNPSVRIKNIGIIETVDLGKLHVARKIGDLKTSFRYIQEYFENPKYISCPIDAVYSIYTKLRNFTWQQLDDLEIYFGYLNDKYNYYNPKRTRTAIKEMEIDTVYLVSKYSSLIQQLYEIFATEITQDNKIIFVGSKQDASHEAIFDEVNIIPFPDGRICLSLWCD